MENNNISPVEIKDEDLYDVGYPDEEIAELQEFLMEIDPTYVDRRAKVKEELCGLREQSHI